MLETEVEQKNIIVSLKKILKLKKITYGDIAKRTDIPESTLRKIFAGRDCKFSIILKICSALDVQLSDVIRETRDDHHDGAFHLNSEQCEYFMGNLDAYWLFLKLLRKLPLKQLLKDFGGDEYRFNAILKDLEKMKLIERHSGNKVKIVPEGALKLEDGDPLHDMIVELVASNLIKALNASKANPFNKLHQQGSVKMTGTTFRRFISDIREAFMKIEQIYKKENEYYSADNSELIDVTFVLGVAEFNSIDIFLK